MRSDVPGRCEACAVRETSLCAGLEGEALVALHAIGRRRPLSAGQVLCWAGDAASVCANLVSGVLKITRTQADGRAQIVGLLYPGDFAGEVFASQMSDTITALTDADLCIYPREALEQTLRHHPAAARLLLRRSLATLNEARRWMPMLARAHADARVAALLLDMARRCLVVDDSYFTLPLSRGAMGEALGLAIETVSRHMSALHSTGLIAVSGGRGMQLLDRPALAKLAG